jgi:hypothetical protein
MNISFLKKIINYCDGEIGLGKPMLAALTRGKNELSVEFYRRHGNAAEGVDYLIPSELHIPVRIAKIRDYFKDIYSFSKEAIQLHLEDELAYISHSLPLRPPPVMKTYFKILEKVAKELEKDLDEIVELYYDRLPDPSEDNISSIEYMHETALEIIEVALEFCAEFNILVSNTDA